MFEPIEFKKGTSITINILETDNPVRLVVSVFTSGRNGSPKYIYEGEDAAKFLNMLRVLIDIDN